MELIEEFPDELPKDFPEELLFEEPPVVYGGIPVELQEEFPKELVASGDPGGIGGELLKKLTEETPRIPGRSSRRLSQGTFG